MKTLSSASRITCSHIEAHVHRKLMDVMCKCLKRIEVSCREFKKICSREGCSVTYDPYSYVKYLTVPGRSHEFVPSARKCDSNAVYLDAFQVLKEPSPRGSHSIIANRRDYHLRVCRVRHQLETVLQLSHIQSFNGSI